MDNATTVPKDPPAATVTSTDPPATATMEPTTQPTATMEETAPADKGSPAEPAGEKAAPEAVVKTETAASDTATTAPVVEETPKNADAAVAQDNTTAEAPAVPVASATASAASTTEAEAPKPAATSSSSADAAASKRPTTSTSNNKTNSEPQPKRQRTDNNEHKQEKGEVLDICAQIGFRPGDRLEVEWQLEGDDGKLFNKWWGCVLQEWDGRTLQEGNDEDKVAIRVVDYDPYPEGHYPDRSQEDVVFLSHDLIMTPNEEQPEFRFRAEGQVSFRNEEEARAAINAILIKTLDKHADKFKNLDRVQQNYVASGIAQKKELLVSAIMDHSKSAVITETTMQQILQGIMQSKR